ncbi:MAG: carbon starvation protein A [Planctomycetota bacterium]|nr:MAG: carbon starvation protein A [Planctomycetota bacterium]
MQTLLIAVGAFVAYLVAYHTYGRWLARRIFNLDPSAVCPSREVNDGRDFVPTPRSVVFGHHFTSIAGTGPIVGPAIAVFWGWLPALLWVLLGSVFIGAVHDFGSLVVSLRSRGQTIGDVAARMVNPRARLLFLLILFLALTVVIGIFGLVIAVIFATYPGSVFPIWFQIPIAIAVGWLVYRRGAPPLAIGLAALALMYLTIWLGAYVVRIDLTQFGLPLTGAAAVAEGLSPYANAVVLWTAALLVYCFIASVLPVWLLLQPRDFINSVQLYVALALLFVGLLITPLTGSDSLEFVAPAINHLPPEFNAPPIWPFLFITIACGAVSGFHCLVSSGTTSKQLRNERDAQMVGYGSMLLEGGLAVLVILACTAGLGKGVYTFDTSSSRYVQQVDPQTDQPLTGRAAWEKYYGAKHWSDFTLRQKIGGFVEGGANMLRSAGVPATLGISLMAVLVACFAATTLDTATRLQRYVITELGAAIRLPALQNKYVATTAAVVAGGALAMIAGPAGPGSGGLILWPIFGATNQLLAGLAFIVILFYLRRLNKPTWFVIPPLLLMLVLPNWAMAMNLAQWWREGKTTLIAVGGAITLLEVWMVIEALLLYGRVRGVPPEPLPPLAARPVTGVRC